MGYGFYSGTNRSARSQTMGYATNSIGEIFSRRSLDNGMDPKNIELRESRDSEEHPNSVSIILGLDVTGSMGKIPHDLVKDGLPNIMGRVMEAGIDDPQLLFLGIGDHKVDRAPLQIGQFESNDELLDKWLTNLYLEGGGGGNGGESYHLAWYFAATRTSIDCFEKRSQKGIIFTIGDEPVHRDLSRESINRFIDGEERSYTASELLSMAQEKYHVYHIHIVHGARSSDDRVIGGWKELVGDNLFLIKNKKDIPNIISSTIAKVMGVDGENASTITETQQEEIIL